LSYANKNIKSIKIYLNSDKINNDGLVELIAAQKKIEELVYMDAVI
ncbi:11529_t:CDS:1, partial [Entrophospora sp. SA101]